jgi:hypothetical protein
VPRGGVPNGPPGGKFKADNGLREMGVAGPVAAADDGPAAEEGPAPVPEDPGRDVS